MKRLMLLLISGAAICGAQGGFSGPGRYVIVNVRSNMALDATRRGVVQNNRDGSRGQTWNVSPAAGGRLTIENEGNGCALTLGGTGNSAPVRCEPLRRRGDDQFWSLQPSRDANLIVARNGRVLDIPNSSTRSGVPVQTHSRNGGDNQRFFFQPARGGPGFGGGRPGGPGGNIVTCSSDNGRRRSCPADTSRGVVIAREFGRNRCIQGQTWGTDRNGIWVDRGCSADFRLGR